LLLPDWLLEPTARGIDGLRALGLQTPLEANQIRLGAAHVYFDSSKARRELFAPQVPIETSLRDTFDWYQRNGYIKQTLWTRLLRLV